MSEELFIVNKKLLPKCYEKVVKAKQLLETGEVDNVSKACEKCGISRGTFYKYQNYVFAYHQENITRKLVVSFTLSHKTGALSRVCDFLSKENVSIITISQSSPIGEVAPVMLSLDISAMKKTVDEFKESFDKISDIKQLKMIAVE